MPLDPSILLQSKPVKLADPMELESQSLALRQQRAQAAQQQKSVADEQTLANLYRKNLSATGEVDAQGMTRGMAEQGLGARIPDYQKSQAAAKKAQTETEAAQFDIHKKKLDYVGGVLSSLINKPDLSTNDGINAINSLVDQGVISPQQGAQMSRQLPGRPEQMRPFLIQKALETMDASKRLESMVPKYNEQDRGGVINQGTVNPLTGERIEGRNIEKSMTPGEAAKAAAAKDSGFSPDEQALLSELALRSVSLPAGLRSQAQIKATLAGLLSRNGERLPSEIADDIKSGKLRLSAENKASQVAGGQVGKVALAINEMKPFGEQVLEASSLLPRGEFVPWNELKQYGEKQVSNPRLLRFKAKMQALENAYNQLAARSGTDVDKRAHIHELFNVANSDEAVQALVQALNEEGFGAKQAAEETVREMAGMPAEKAPAQGARPPLDAILGPKK